MRSAEPEAVLNQAQVWLATAGGLVAVAEGALAVGCAKCVYGLVGPNGAGNTTMLSIITGMRPPIAAPLRWRFRGATSRCARMSPNSTAG